MDSESVPFLLVTANVGSVFEDPLCLLSIWIEEFLNKVTFLKPSFIALHLQEVGGKTYEKSMEYVQEFIKKLCEATELKQFNRIRIYLDEDYNSAEHFTALGNLYFANNSIKSLEIWNFLTHAWENVEGKSIHTGNIESIATKEKAKFPQRFFPECKWSRKGFLRTRWLINGTAVDMVNIHLFHDASNLVACEEYPSVYCKSRRKALIHTLERFHTDTVNGFAPYFVFGDFNFRCDTEGIVKKLTEDLTAHRVQNIKNDNTKMQYRNSDGQNVLTIGKKEFNHVNHQTKFKEDWMHVFDRELEPLKNILNEYTITFHPSYPYEEDPQMPHNYMFTRCPAWCDRILISNSAKQLIENVENLIPSEAYNVIGENVCMGDHKPVYLHIWIKSKQGIIQCCEHEKDDHNSEMNAPIAIVIAKYKSSCLYCSRELSKTFRECLNLENINSIKIPHNKLFNSIESDELLDAQRTYRAIKTPLVSINVTDTDNNFNVCMCSFENTDDIIFEQNYSKLSDDGTICPRCTNIIKPEPFEHHRTLISKRLMLSNDIIVNRIDTQFLSTYATNNEPYTPESVESHSPLPEMLSYSNDNENKENSKHIVNTCNQIDQRSLAVGVSPRQLKSRLERLRTISFYNENRRKRSHRNKKNICNMCCIVL